MIKRDGEYEFLLDWDGSLWNAKLDLDDNFCFIIIEKWVKNSELNNGMFLDLTLLS